MKKSRASYGFIIGCIIGIIGLVAWMGYAYINLKEIEKRSETLIQKLPFELKQGRIKVNPLTGRLQSTHNTIQWGNEIGYIEKISIKELSDQRAEIKIENLHINIKEEIKKIPTPDELRAQNIIETWLKYPAEMLFLCEKENLKVNIELTLEKTQTLEVYLTVKIPGLSNIESQMSINNASIEEILTRSWPNDAALQEVSVTYNDDGLLAPLMDLYEKLGPEKETQKTMIRKMSEELETGGMPQKQRTEIVQKIHELLTGQTQTVHIQTNSQDPILTLKEPLTTLQDWIHKAIKADLKIN